MEFTKGSDFGTVGCYRFNYPFSCFYVWFESEIVREQFLKSSTCISTYYFVLSWKRRRWISVGFSWSPQKKKKREITRPTDPTWYILFFDTGKNKTRSIIMYYSCKISFVFWAIGWQKREEQMLGSSDKGQILLLSQSIFTRNIYELSSSKSYSQRNKFFWARMCRFYKNF